MKTSTTRTRKEATRRTYRDSKHGTGYDAFRTGVTFKAARRMLHGMPSRSNPERFRDKSRRSVLGFMHELKLQLWAQIQEARYMEVSQ